VNGSAARVGIVGGGLAGLSAAIACLDRGAEVHLFESRPRLGGATWSFERHGLRFDNGQHVYLRCCTAYRRLLERLGTAELAPIKGALEIPVYSPARAGHPARRSVIRRSPLPAPAHLAPALMSFSHLSWRDRLGLGRALLALQRLELSDPVNDEESFGAFLRRHGQSARAIECLFDLIVLPTTNLRCEQVSLAVGAKVFKTGLLEESDAADIGWADTTLELVHVEPAARLIEELGGRISRRTEVDAIELQAGERPALRVGGERLDFDAVVLATQPDRTARLLAPLDTALAGRAGALSFEPIIDLHFVFDRPVMRDQIAAAVDSPVQYLFDRSVPSGLEGPGQCLALSVSGAEREIGERPEVLRERYLAALGELFPEARSATLVDFVVSREREATFCAIPGSGRHRLGADSGLPGVYLAGAWTDTGWPATMEGAVRSGNTAAWFATAGTRRDRAPHEIEEVA
jgi:squalene-associated FAD-dependent desaturase